MGKRLLWLIVSILMACNLGSGCTLVSRQHDNSLLPDISMFSSTEYTHGKYMFPKIKSAVFYHDGIIDTISPEDPRLFRLLNAIIFSYEQGYTAWRQGLVQGDEFQAYVNSGYPMLDISFELDNAVKYSNEFSDAPRIVISANCYLLLADPGKSSWMPEDSIFANEHYPFATSMIDNHESASGKEIPEYGDMAWGNDRWIDLLAYAGFYQK